MTIFYTAPTAIRACMKWGVEHVEKADLSKLRLLGTVGEPINPKAWLWYYTVVGGERCPIVDTWWQTETGAIMITPLPGDRGHQARLGHAGRSRASRPTLSMSARASRSTQGQGLLVLERPWPSMLRTLYKEDDRFVETYFCKFGKETYWSGTPRARTRTATSGSSVASTTWSTCPATGCRPPRSSPRSSPTARSPRRRSSARPTRTPARRSARSSRSRATLEGSDELVEEIRAQVADRIGKFARPKRIIWADDLPKTRSGKIMRRLLRDIAEGRALGDVTTLRDPDVMAQLEGKIKEEQTAEES